MSIEVGGGLVAKLEAFKKNSAERKKAKAHKRLDKRLRQNAYARSDGKMRVGYSPAYAEGWERIFGKKTGDSVQGEGAGVSEGLSEHVRDEGPAAGPSR